MDRPRLRSLRHRHLDVEGAVAALHPDRRRLARLERRHGIEQLRRVRDRRAGDPGDDVARPEAALARRPGLDHAGDQHPLRHREVERLGDLGREIARLDADPAARDLAVLDQAVHHLAGGGHRNGEADPEAAAAARVDRGVDAEQVAVDVDQRAARIAGVDRRVGLDEVLEDVDAERVAAERADDAGGHRLADAERIADRQHDVADLQPVGVAEGDHRQLVEVDLEDGDVRFGVAADRPRLGAAPVAEQHLDIVGALDHVVVGEQVAGRRDDHARAEADLALLGHLPGPVAEEVAVHRIVGCASAAATRLAVMLTTAGEARLAATL